MPDSVPRRLASGGLGRLGKVPIRHLQVVLVRDWRAVTQPVADDVQRESRRQLARRFWNSLGQGVSPVRLDDPQQLAAHVGIPIPVTADDVFRAGFGQLKHLLEERPQFRE